MFTEGKYVIVKLISKSRLKEDLNNESSVPSWIHFSGSERAKRFAFILSDGLGIPAQHTVLGNILRLHSRPVRKVLAC